MTDKITDKKENFLQEEKKQTNIIQAPKVINDNIFSAKMTAPFSIAIDKAMDDSKQLTIDMDENKNFIQNALVVYEKAGQYTTEILFQGFFNTLSTEEFDSLRSQGAMVRDSGEFSILLRKIRHIFEARLFEQYENNGNVFIMIKDKELAKMLNKPQSFISAKMPEILKSLLNIQIQKFQLARKSRNQESFAKVNIVEAVKREKGASYILFGQLYAYYVAQWGYTQFPLELLQTDDKNYRLAFDIGTYIAEMKYYNRNEFTMKSLYERVTAIPRYEDVKTKMHSKYFEKIYSPVERALDYLNNFIKTFSISYSTDYIKDNGSYDFDKWLDTMIHIEWNIQPNYAGLEAGREKGRKEAKKKKNKKNKDANKK